MWHFVGFMLRVRSFLEQEGFCFREKVAFFCFFDFGKRLEVNKDGLFVAMPALCCDMSE